MALEDKREQRIVALRQLAKRSRHHEEAQLFNQLAEFYERQQLAALKDTGDKFQTANWKLRN
jgi:hypothetical protein